jgi:hypothetical protein
VPRLHTKATDNFSLITHIIFRPQDILRIENASFLRKLIICSKGSNRKFEANNTSDITRSLVFSTLRRTTKL